MIDGLSAHAEGNLIAAADAWADRAYVLFGDAVATGLPTSRLFAEIHRSNMTKEPDPNGTGKAVKGPAYQQPNVQNALDSASGIPLPQQPDTESQTRGPDEHKLPMQTRPTMEDLARRS